MAAFGYRYEFREGEVIVATGYLTREAALLVGERLSVGGRQGRVLSIEATLDSGQRRVVIRPLDDGA